jgi:hypothetical protein
MSDRLHDTLSALRTEVDHMPLADSSAVRARGNQRTRRQAVGTSLAVVALVAGVIGASAALTGNNKAEPLPADPTVKTDVAISPEMLLTVEDLPWVAPHRNFFLHETLAGEDRSADAAQRNLTVCGQPPAGGTSPERALLRTFGVTGNFGTMWQWVAQYPDAEAAQQAFTELESGCPVKNGIKKPLANGLPEGATGFQASIFTAEGDNEPFAEIASVVRHGDAVVVLDISAWPIKEDVNLDDFDAAVVEATQRIASRSAAAPDPTVETRKPIATDLLVGANELPTFPNQPFSIGETLDSATTADAQERILTVCGTAPNGGVTPDSAVLRTFVTDLDAFMWQWVAQYPTAEEAATVVSALSQRCTTEGADVAVGTPNTAQPGFRMTQFSADPGSEFNGQVVAVVQQSDVVIVLGLRAMVRKSEVDLEAFDASVVNATERVATR